MDIMSGAFQSPVVGIGEGRTTNTNIKNPVNVKCSAAKPNENRK